VFHSSHAGQTLRIGITAGEYTSLTGSMRLVNTAIIIQRFTLAIKCVTICIIVQTLALHKKNPPATPKHFTTRAPIIVSNQCGLYCCCHLIFVF